jgi:hypothetical protein
MWYRFSKVKWIWDVVDGIEYSYAYVKADSEKAAITKCNESPIPNRRYSNRGLDQIDEVYTIPMEEMNKVVY